MKCHQSNRVCLEGAMEIETSESRIARQETRNKGQNGAGLLSIVTGMGVIAALVQGSLYYQAKSSNAFILSEAHKTLAREMAEAGIEANIADIGQGALTITEGMDSYATYDREALGDGAYSTNLSAVGTSPEMDTIDINSTGFFRSQSHSILARLKVRKYFDTVSTISMITAIDTNSVVEIISVPDTTVTVTQMDPADMPALNEQPAYDACLASSAKKCDICHIPSGNPDNRHVQSVSKSAIDTHVDHHGDYVTTDGTCDMYDPVETLNITMVASAVTVVTYDTTAVFDTALVISERSKTQVLSWK